MTQRLKIWALVAGAALFEGVLLIFWHFTNLSLSIVMGFELSILFFWSLGRAFFGRIAAYRNLRNAKLLLAIPIGLFSLAAFADAWPSTSAYAPWILAGTILFYFGVTKRYVKRLRGNVQVDEGVHE